VRVGGGDGAVEAKADRRAVLEGPRYLGGGGMDEEKSKGETHDGILSKARIARNPAAHPNID
jgi:hypothetical protein